MDLRLRLFLLVIIATVLASYLQVFLLLAVFLCRPMHERFRTRSHPGPDLARLDTEMGKLAAASNGQPITRALVVEHVGLSDELLKACRDTGRAAMRGTGLRPDGDWTG